MTLETTANTNTATTPTTIRMSEELSNIAPAMCAIQSKLKPIAKTGKNTQQNYNYAKFEDFVEHVRDILSQHDMFLVTNVSEPKRLEPRPTRSGGFQYGVEVRVTVRILHKSSEWMEIDCYGEGQDSGDKAIYKAVTGARKYALACLLGLSTTDDPEKDSDDDQPPRQSNYKTGDTRNSTQSKPNNYTNKGTSGGNARPGTTGTTQNNNQSRANGANPPPAHDKKTGEVKTPPPAIPPEEGGITYAEVMNHLRIAKNAADIINALDHVRGLKMTAEERAELVKLKDEMKAKVQG